jgi:hypothetical protein
MRPAAPISTFNHARDSPRRLGLLLQLEGALCFVFAHPKGAQELREAVLANLFSSGDIGRHERVLFADKFSWAVLFQSGRRSLECK